MFIDGKEYDVKPLRTVWNKGKTGIYSKATIDKMRLQAKNRSAESRKKTSEALKGRKRSAEEKDKISIALKNSVKHKQGLANRDMSNVIKRMKNWHQTPEKQELHRQHNLKQKNPVMTPRGYFIGTTEAAQAFGYKCKTSVIGKCKSTDPKYADWYYIEKG